VLDGDAEIAPGIRAIFSPGHTPGHMAYLVHGRWLLTVDAIECQENLDRDVPIGSSADPADAPLRRKSHDRLKAIAAETGATIVPGHDAEVWARLATRPARR
jgi:glyoxylase-like metal-dependent hydrolase (beta-lactamase superfamily II)